MKIHICTTSRAARAAANVTAVNMGGYVYCHLVGLRHAGKLLPAFVVKDADNADIAFFCISQALTPILTAFAPVVVWLYLPSAKVPEMPPKMPNKA